MASSDDIPDPDSSPWDCPFTIRDVLQPQNLRQFYGAVQVIDAVDGLGAALDFERTHQNRGEVKRRLRERIRVIGDSPPLELTGHDDIVAAVTSTTPDSAEAIRASAEEDATNTGEASGSAIPGVNGTISSGETVATAGSTDG